MALVLKSKKTMEMIEKGKQKGGGGANYFKPEPNAKDVFKVFICPPKNEDVSIIQKVVVHEIFNQTGKVAGCVSPSNWEEKDPFIKLGWNLRKKYSDHKSQKVKDFFKYLVGKSKNIIHVINPEDTEKGIQSWQAPQSVVDFILNDIEQNDGDMDFCHPQTGKALVVKKTGSGLLTKYACAWSKNAVELDGIDEDKLSEMLDVLPDSILGSMFKKPTKDEIEDYREAVDVLAEKLKVSINWKNTKDSNLEVDDDADLDDDSSTEKEDEDDDFAEDDDLDLEDDADEKPKADPKKEAAAKKKALEDKKALEAKKAADAKKKAGSKAVEKKKPVEDEDDMELDEDDLDLDEE